jgi:hypothetical protein
MRINCDSKMVDRVRILEMNAALDQFARNKTRAKIKKLLMNIPIGYLIDDVDMDEKLDEKPLMSYDTLMNLLSDKERLRGFLFGHFDRVI